MANGDTAKEILAQANATRRDLADLERELQEEIDEIDFRVFQEDRDPTPAERPDRKARRAAQAEVRAASTELVYVTLRRLGESDEVVRLQRKMKEINSGLDDDLDRLGDIVRYAETAARVAEGIAKVVDKLADLAA